MKPYNHDNIPLAQSLRKNMTPWERKLWFEFLRKYPVRIYRQKALGNYIVDFYCAKAKLVIELDGSGHFYDNQSKADAERTAVLERMDLSVIRVPNIEIDKNFSGVCEYIDSIIKDRI